MKLTLNPDKYRDVPEALRERLFAFARRAEPREMAHGKYPFSYLAVALAQDRAVIAFAQPACPTLAEYLEAVDAVLVGEGVTEYCAAGSSMLRLHLAGIRRGDPAKVVAGFRERALKLLAAHDV
jgi:hypothetical protein